MAWTSTLPIGSTKIRDLPGVITGNSQATQSVLSQTNLVNSTAYIPTTHPIFFYANVAPTGWTLVAAPADCLLAVKGGASQYNVSGGTIAGTWNGPAVALTIPQLPAHTHSVSVPALQTGFDAKNDSSLNVPKAQNTSYTTSSTGSGATHQHDWNTTRPRAAVGIICSKNA